MFPPEATKAIEDCIDAHNGELRELSLKIHDHPEVAWKEKYAHDILTDFMSSKGFEVTRHYLGLDTAWQATFTRGNTGRVLGFNSEMDALPGIGHACGHNLIAIGGVAAAIGVKAAMEKHGINGKVVLLGTPAEEHGSGKVILLDRGGYNEMHACFMVHPVAGPECTAGLSGSPAFDSLEIEYFGNTAHATAAPWDGRNALDAAVIAYSAVSLLRQQIKPDCRVNGVIHGRDWVSSIIPGYAKMNWDIHAPSWAEVQNLRKRVVNCFEAASLATGCRMELKRTECGYEERQNASLANEFAAVMKRYGIRILSEKEDDTTASTDFGNVTHKLPAIEPTYAIPTEPNGGNHTPAFTKSARTEEAHIATLTAAKGIGIVGLRVIVDDGFYEKVKESFECGRTTVSTEKD